MKLCNYVRNFKGRIFFVVLNDDGIIELRNKKWISVAGRTFTEDELRQYVSSNFDVPFGLSITKIADIFLEEGWILAEIKKPAKRKEIK